MNTFKIGDIVQVTESTGLLSNFGIINYIEGDNADVVFISDNGKAFGSKIISTKYLYFSADDHFAKSVLSKYKTINKKSEAGYSVAHVAGLDLDRRAIGLCCNKTGRIVPMFIGGTEFIFIINKLSKEKFERPLPWNLLSSIIEKLNGKLNKVSIDEIIEGVYTATLFLSDNETGKRFELDARASDAVALALDNDLPIFIGNSIVSAMGGNQ